jgi:homoserine O-acetyltransferase
MGDPDFAGGRYTRQPERGWRDWAVIMRGLASRTPAALAAMPDHQAWLRAAQDTVLDTGLDANDYIAQSHAYDAHDVGTTPGFSGDTDAALRAVRAAALIAAPTLDLYNPAECARDAAAKIPGARLVELPTIMGHHAASAADPASVALLDREIGKFLD